MADLAGRNEAPQLAGNNFMNTWRNRSTKDLFEFIQSTMPPTGENLSAAQYLAVTAYILQANGAPAGEAALTATTAVPIGSTATGATPTAAAAAAPPAGRGAAPGGRQGAPARSRSGAGRRTRRRACERGTARRHGLRHGEELRTGDRRDASQSGSGRLADGAPQLSGVEPQSADPDHARQRQGTAAGVELGDERGPGQRAVAAGAQRRALSRQHPEHRPGDRRANRRSDLGKPRGTQRADRPGGDAEHGDLPGQGVRRHHRRATGRARRAHRRQGVGYDHRGSRQGLRQHRGPDGHEGRGRQRPGRLRSLRQRRLLDQRLQRRGRQAAVEVQYRPPRHGTRRRDVGQAGRQPPDRRRNLDCRELRSRSRHHLLGGGAGEAVDAREPRLIELRQRPVHELHRGAAAEGRLARVALPARAGRIARPRRSVRARAGRHRRSESRVHDRQAGHPVEARSAQRPVPWLQGNAVPECVRVDRSENRRADLPRRHPRAANRAVGRFVPEHRGRPQLAVDELRACRAACS